MKFLLALLVTLAMGVVLGVGILSAVHGNPWVLIAAGVAYLLAFARLGCLPPGKGEGRRQKVEG